MKEDARLKGQEYSWLGTVFYFGYIAMELPAGYLLSQAPLSKMVSLCMMAWGASLAGMAACHDFASLALCRALLGAFEATFLPAFVVMTSTWFRKSEQPLRMALWYNPIAGIFGGLLAYVIGHIHGELQTWRYIFLIYGIATILIAVVIFLILPDSPSSAWFLTMEERRLAVLRLESHQFQTNTKSEWDSSEIYEALHDMKYWIILLSALAQQFPNSGVTNFNTLIISDLGYSPLKTSLLATPQAVVALLAQLTAAAICRSVRNMRCVLWVIGCLIGCLGAGLVYFFGGDQGEGKTEGQVVTLVGLYLMGFYNMPWVMMLSLVSSNVTGVTKKAFVSGSIAVVYAIGNMIGPQVFLESQRPQYSLGICSTMAGFLIMAICGVAYAGSCIRDNSGKYALYKVIVPDDDDSEAERLTTARVSGTPGDRSLCGTNPRVIGGIETWKVQDLSFTYVY